MHSYLYVFSSITLENFKEIIDMLLEGKINSLIADDVILAAVKTPTLSSRKVNFRVFIIICLLSLN